MRHVLTLLGILAALYVLACALLFACQNRLMHLPDDEIVADPGHADLAYERVAIDTRDGLRLDGWLVPAQEPRGALLFFHGNAGNISHRIESLRIFHELGLTTLIVDYRGYGRSEGSPTESGLYKDAEAALAFLRERGLRDREIVYFGRSLGGAVAAHLAARAPPGALILESTFTSAPDVAAEHFPIFPVRLLARLSYPAEDNIAEVDRPVLVIHSPDDEIVPYAHGRALRAAAPGPASFLEIEGDHNTGFLHSRQRYTDGLDAFLSEHLPP